MVLASSDLAPPGGPGINTTQRQAIGALCHDAGVAVNMSYASGGSGTDTLKAADAFTPTFGYSNAIKGRRSDWGNIGTPLNDMVNPNLDAGYPVLLGITGSSGGHAIVCDGYGYNSSTLYHHLNMGWSGSYNAWYALPNIETFVTFTSVYKCVYNVYVSGSGEIIAGRVVDESSQPIAGATVTAARSGGGNYSDTTDVNGVFGIAKVPADSTYTVSVSKVGYSFTNQQVSTGTSMANSTTVEFQWDAGVGVTQYWLKIGSSLGAGDYLERNCGTNLSWTAQNLPTDGSRVYVRPMSLIDSVWQSNDYWYTAKDGGGAQAALTAPAGPVLAGAADTFAWTTGTGVRYYALWVGSSVGAKDYYARTLKSTIHSQLVTTLPTDGSTVHVRLYSLISGVWYWEDYTFTASN